MRSDSGEVVMCLRGAAGSLLGLIIYHERLSGQPGQIALELAACAAAIWGIARLAGSAAVTGAQQVLLAQGE